MSDSVIPFRRSDRAAVLPEKAFRRRDRAARRRRARVAVGASLRAEPRGALPPGSRELVARSVARHGAHVVHVGESCDCPDCASAPLPTASRFGYTVGLTEVGHPELLVRGLGARETADVLTGWAGAVLDGDQLGAGEVLCDGADGPRWELARADGRELVWAYTYYGRPAHDPGPALELVPTSRPCRCSDPF